MPLIKQSECFEIREKMRDGVGKAKAFCAPVLKGMAITAANRMELEPNASIGLHTHIDDEEVYAILSGNGIFCYGEGECKALSGDIFVTHAGMSHSLRNTSSTEPLVFFAIMAKK